MSRGGGGRRDAPVEGTTWTGRCSARAGVAGNPSDALGGAALAVPVDALGALVELRPSSRLSIRAAGDSDGWGSVADLVTHSERFGHEGGNRLVSAAIVTLARVARQRGVDLADESFEVRWSTDIPRSVGLAGSSALVIATMRALLDRWDLELGVETLAALALDAESVELGVAAGWMDRATQAAEVATLVDTRSTVQVDGREVPLQRRVQVGAPLELVVAWDPAGAAPSGRLHAGLRDRAAAGDTVVLGAVDALVVAAEDATAAMERGDRSGLADAVERTRHLRQGLGALDDHTAALAELASVHGAAATSAGSGGAVLVVPGSVSAAGMVERLVERGRPALRIDLG